MNSIQFSKADEVLAYLDEKIFNPILDSQKSSQDLKQGIRLTRNRMISKDAKGIVQFFWSAIGGTDRSINFSSKMKSEGFKRFEDILEEFREQFNDKWLKE